jgi:glycerol-3-phosphate dehydrogenase (NAD(P)+)
MPFSLHGKTRNKGAWPMKYAVIGAGSWGTTLATLLAGNGLQVMLWGRQPELVNEINRTRENPVYLPGVTLAPSLSATTDLEAAADSAECFVFVVPSQHLATILGDIKGHLPRKPAVVCASKGIELSTLSTMSQVVSAVMDDIKPRFAMLSGPSFAAEVARGLPTAVALGCEDRKLAARLQKDFSTSSFRVYTNSDYRGVELGGAVKNIMAIAAGIADGLEFGANARAALITRGLAEMTRLGVAMGAEAATFMGLAGMGDLVLTCTGDLSRNRTVGLKLGQGHKLLDILGEMKMVAEGVKTTESVYNLSLKMDVDLPITREVYRVLYDNKDPGQAVMELMTRELKQE